MSQRERVWAWFANRRHFADRSAAGRALAAHLAAYVQAGEAEHDHDGGAKPPPVAPATAAKVVTQPSMAPSTAAAR